MPPHEQAVDDRSNMVLSACDQLKSWIDDTHFNLAFQSGRTGLEAGNELHLVIGGLTRARLVDYATKSYFGLFSMIHAKLCLHDRLPSENDTETKLTDEQQRWLEQTPPDGRLGTPRSTLKRY